MQVYGVCINSSNSIILPEDEVRRLFIVLVHQLAVPLPLLGQLVREGAIAALVSLVSSVEAGLTLAALGLCEVAQAVVFGFCRGRLGVVEGLEKG